MSELPGGLDLEYLEARAKGVGRLDHPAWRWSIGGVYVVSQTISTMFSLGVVGVLREAALWTPIVAVGAYAGFAGIDWIAGGAPDQLLWMIHEVLFVALAAFVRNVVIVNRTDATDPNRVRLKRVMSFVMLYYGLWASSDALILWGGLDAGWLLRVVPNQLYYAVWIPFVYATFFSEREGRTSNPSSP